MRVGDLIQYTNLSHLVSDWGIYYDADPLETIIQEDKPLIELWRETEDLQQNTERKISKWLLRFRMNTEPMSSIFNDYFEF